MDDSVKVILKKLDDIDSRIQKLEHNEKPVGAKMETIASAKHDPFLSKAVEIMDKFDEISAQKLMDELKVDKNRAEKLLDELEAAGYGTCYWKEA